MGCFLTCFGLSKEAPKKTNSHPHADQVQVLGATDGILDQEIRIEKEVSSRVYPHVRDELEEKPNVGLKKKVTFDSNVVTYEHIPVIEEDEDCRSENDDEKGEEISDEIRVLSFSKSGQSHSSASEDGSVISTSSFYPPNHRYRNCRDSDDDYEEFEQLGEEDNCSDEEEDDDYVDEEEEDYNDSTPKLIVRERSAYDHSVLRPIENVIQFRAMKATARRKGEESLKREQKYPNEDEIAVDVSLSNWLRTSDKKKDENDFESEKRSIESNSSDSVISFQETPISGSFERYWTEDDFEKEEDDDSFRICASSSFKGIPNSNRKYSEDQRVKWHSTPFETRLERALERVGGARCILQEK